MRTSATLKGLAPLLSGLLYLAAAYPANAEQYTYTLSQVVEYAQQHNGDLTAFREEKGLREAGKVKAGLLPNPTIELECGTGALTGNSAENSLSLGVSQEFPLAGKQGKRVAVAERELEMYGWQLADRKRQLLEEVKTAFYDIILAERRVALADRAIALNRQLLRVAEERLAAGDIPELDVNLVKVELARSEGARIDTTITEHQSQAKLSMLMGTPTGEFPVITGNLDTKVSVTTLADLKRLANDHRPDLKALEAEKGRGEADITLARVEGVPNLTAGLALKRDTTTMEIGGVEGKETSYTIALKLSMPIPLFDRNQAGIQEARARRNSTESRLTAATRIIEREVETAYVGYLNSEKALTLYKTTIIPQLEENLKLTEEAYRLGEIGILAVIQEQKKFFEVNDAYLAALHGRQTAGVKLESAVATELTGGVQ